MLVNAGAALRIAEYDGEATMKVDESRVNTIFAWPSPLFNEDAVYEKFSKILNDPKF